MDNKKEDSSIMLSPVEMTVLAKEIGEYKAHKQPLITFISAITAGVFIALAFVFYTTTQTATAEVSWGMAKLVGGLVFSLGIILVVVCGSDLFTSSTLLVVAQAERLITLPQMLKNWVIVYLGNFVGSLFIVFLIWFGHQTMVAHGQWGLVILDTAQHKIHHGFFEAFCLGTLCNIMVCIGVWMSYAGKTLADKVLVLILPIGMFVASGFEHCVANMFMVPMGIVTAHHSTAGFWQNLGIESSKYMDLTPSNFVMHNLIPVTLGNIFGGAICIGLVYWYMNIHKYKH